MWTCRGWQIPLPIPRDLCFTWSCYWFLAGLQSNFGLWIDDVHPSVRLSTFWLYFAFKFWNLLCNPAIGCNSVIFLRPKIGVEPPKHDVISMPTQQYTNTNYISLERSHLVVSIMLRYMDRIKTFNDNLSCREVKIDKKFWGDLPYFALKCDKFL